MDRERRERLGIPIHDQDRDHMFVDGFCCCGATDPTRKPPAGALRTEGSGSLWQRPVPERRSRTDLDRIEDNREEYFG